MKIKKSFIFLFGFILILSAVSCISQEIDSYIHVPDESFFVYEETIGVNIDNIVETRDGYGAKNIPNWLRIYLTGGAGAVERFPVYRNKYVFIESNRGENFSALNKWLDFFIVKQDISKLIAARVERKMISAASLYPDDEYGLFFERMIKNAYNTEYPEAVLENTYWIKIKNDEEDEEYYLFFIFSSMDKMTTQKILEDMIETTFKEVYSSKRRFSRNPQAASVNKLRQTFFEGF